MPAADARDALHDHPRRGRKVLTRRRSRELLEAAGRRRLRARGCVAGARGLDAAGSRDAADPEARARARRLPAAAPPRAHPGHREHRDLATSRRSTPARRARPSRAVAARGSRASSSPTARRRRAVLTEPARRRRAAARRRRSSTGDFIRAASAWLEERLAPETLLHGVLVEVLGLGVLILGKSGIGKSEAALDLVVARPPPGRRRRRRRAALSPTVAARARGAAAPSITWRSAASASSTSRPVRHARDARRAQIDSSSS